MDGWMDILLASAVLLVKRAEWWLRNKLMHSEILMLSDVRGHRVHLSDSLNSILSNFSPV